MFKIMREIYYRYLSTLLHFIHSGYWYCFCHKHEGCKLNYNRGPILCLICQFTYGNNEETFEMIKYDKTILMFFYFELLNMNTHL